MNNAYLTKPPILVPPVPEKLLLLYLTTIDTTMGALLTQYLKETRKENEIYYISKKMLPYEEKYSPLEKKYVALVWATRKLKEFDIKYVTQKSMKGSNKSKETFCIKTSWRLK